MYKQLNVTIKGVAPLLLNNILTANPLHPITKLTKTISQKRGKTDADHELLAKLQWIGALYSTEDGSVQINNEELVLEGFGFPCIHGEMLEAMLIGAAKKKKLGQQFKVGVMCDGVFELDFPNKRTIPEMYGDAKFVDTRGCKLQGKTTIMATRAIFREWSLKFTIFYSPEAVNPAQIKDALQVEGVAIGTYRPKFGRFILDNFKEVGNGTH